MKILFICNQNKNRSKTAEELFKGKFETRSVGLYNDNPVTEEEIMWADVVIVMQSQQRSELARRSPKAYMQKRILSFDVPDIYGYNDSDLSKLLNQKMREIKSIVTTH